MQSWGNPLTSHSPELQGTLWRMASEIATREVDDAIARSRIVEDHVCNIPILIGEKTHL